MVDVKGSGRGSTLVASMVSFWREVMALTVRFSTRTQMPVVVSFTFET